MKSGTLVTVVVSIDDMGPLETAIDLARRFGMHLDVICVEAEQVIVSTVLTPDMLVMQEVLEEGRRALAAKETKVEERLRAEDIPWSTAALDPLGAPLGGMLARRLRFADLAVLPRISRTRTNYARVFEAILFASRVPILITDTAPEAFDRIVIGWDGSDVALAAVRAGMPFLKAAGTVEIVMIDPAEPTQGHGLAAMLSRHGVSADVVALSREGERPAERLLNHVREEGADLLIAGAYGHARIQETVLGGVTRDLLRSANVPLLLAR